MQSTQRAQIFSMQKSTFGAQLCVENRYKRTEPLRVFIERRRTTQKQLSYWRVAWGWTHAFLSFFSFYLSHIFHSVSPCNVEVLAELGILYLKINEVDRANEKLQEAISIEMKYTNCLLALGAIHQSRNDIDLALNAYKNIPKIQDEGFEIWSNIGLCFYRKNKLIAVIIIGIETLI